MKRHCAPLCGVILGVALLMGAPPSSWSDEGHDDDRQDTLEQMKKMHKEHEHGHDFEAMEHVSPADMQRMMAAMMDIGLALPPMDSHRGRALFLEKGCVVCHAVNGVGGAVGPSLNAADMPEPMNAFDFAARMWRGAPAMVQMQEDMLGEVVALSGQDLADLIAFAHDEAEQRELEAEQIPTQYRDLVVR